MFCPNCGAQVSETSTFCPKCGTRLIFTAPENQQPETPAYYAKNYQQPKRRGGFVRIGLPIIGACLALMILAVACDACLSSGPDDEAAAPTASAELTLSPEEIKAQFMESCTEIDYNELLRYPDQYKDTNIKIYLRVAQTLRNSQYRCYDETDDWYFLGNEYVITDKRVDDDTKILVDDILLVYGTFTGLDEQSRALTGVSEEFPMLDAVYVEINPPEPTAAPAQKDDTESTLPSAEPTPGMKAGD